MFTYVYVYYILYVCIYIYFFFKSAFSFIEIIYDTFFLNSISFYSQSKEAKNDEENPLIFSCFIIIVI